MEETGAYLFVYGTLLDAKNEFGAYIRQHCTRHGNGKFKGELYDIGEYPGALLKPDNNQFVHGIIYILDNPDEILKILDDYEGFGADQPQPNEFIRTRISIEGGLGLTDCWVYLYNLPVNGLVQIANGDYLRYKGLK